MSNFRSINGRTSIIGPSKEYAVPISLDPLYYKGGLVLGTDGYMYHSNGTAWIKGQSTIGTVNLIGSVPDVSIGPDEQTVLNNAFPGAVQNDGVVDEVTSELWVYSGSGWENTGNIVGPTGLTGSQGLQGAASTVPGPTGPTGPVGGIGPQGVQGIQGSFGPTGPTGIQGNVGAALEVIGSVPDVLAGPGDEQDVLNTAFPGAVNGNGVLDEAGGDLWVYNGVTWENVGQIAGPTGPTGLQGAQGTQASQGIQGSLGIQGSTGVGAQGTQGAQGIQGIQGMLGNQGIQGTKGTSIDIVGSVPDVQAGGDPQATLNNYVLVTLGLPSVDAGMAVINSLDGNIWVYDGVLWQDEGRIVGPTGDTGVQGTDGLQGAQGRQGTQAAQGIQGIQGMQGVQGGQGTAIAIIGSVPDVNVIGDPQATLNAAFPAAVVGNGVIDTLGGDLWMYNGAVWQNTGTIVGPQGAQGVQGTTGPQGIQGRQGRQGIQGLQGISGDLGAIGAQGTQGIQGRQGIQGISGTLGAIGPQGTAGSQGTQGSQGIAGTLGSQGTTGTQGVQGRQGIQGNFGPGTTLDTIADNSSTLLYPVLVDGIGEQTPKITTTAGRLSFNASTGVLTTTATAARYADLAENYLADADYEDGTVLIIGGIMEVTQSGAQDSSKVAGVVSTNPSYLMNCELDGEHVATVALRGRVPCKVVGKVNKGDVLVTSSVAGHAMASAQPNFVSASCIVGKALESTDADGASIIEIMV